MKKIQVFVLTLIAAILGVSFALYAFPEFTTAISDMVSSLPLAPRSTVALCGAPIIMMAITWSDVEELTDVDNTGGTQVVAWFIPWADIDDFPDMPADSGTLDQLAEVTGDIVMVNNKRAYAIYGTQETGEVKHTLQGELDGQSYRSSYSFFTPKNAPKQVGLARALKNARGIWIPIEASGRKRLLGHPGYLARLISAEGGTGQGTAGRNGNTYTIESVWGGPAPVFSGRIDLTGTGYDSTGTDYQDIVYGD